MHYTYHSDEKMHTVKEQKLKEYFAHIGATINCELIKFEKLSDYDYCNTYDVNILTKSGWYFTHIKFIYESDLVCQYVNYQLSVYDIMLSIDFDDCWALSGNQITCIKSILER